MTDLLKFQQTEHLRLLETRQKTGWQRLAGKRPICQEHSPIRLKRPHELRRDDYHSTKRPNESLLRHATCEPCTKLRENIKVLATRKINGSLRGLAAKLSQEKTKERENLSPETNRASGFIKLLLHRRHWLRNLSCTHQSCPCESH